MLNQWDSFAVKIEEDVPPNSLGDLPLFVLSQKADPKAFP